jgi:tetratricopeptide (TPR) repeat protein
MHQQAHGVGNVQVSVEASENVNIYISNGQVAVELLLPPFPRKLPPRREEIDLLKAAHAQIPFIGRDAIFRNFVDWCSDPLPLSMRTVVGQGGAGKTRFAYQLYAHIRNQPGWTACFLHFLKNDAKEVDLWKHVQAGNTLIIADYASDFSKPLADLLRSLVTKDPPAGCRIRVLLLARTGDWEKGWLSDLRSGRTGEDVDRYFDPREPIAMPGFTPEERRAIYARTLEQAAQFAGKPAPPPPSVEEFTKKEVAERLADPLTLMMSALISLHSGSAAAFAMNRVELAHEVAHKLVADRMRDAVESHNDLFLHMAAYATLCGGLEEDQALRALEEESSATHLGTPGDPAQFLGKLQGWLPGEKTKTWIGAIEPDIVGEAYVLGGSKRVYFRDSDATVLRAANQRRESAIKTIIRIAQDFCLSSAEAHSSPLSWLEKLVERGAADEDLGLLIELSNAMPQFTVVLRNHSLGIAAILSARLQRLSAGAPDAERVPKLASYAASLNNLAVRQSEAGQREQALATAREAAELRRDLAAGNRGAFLPALAGSLNNLAVCQRQAGQRVEALATVREAAKLWRELAAGNRAAFLPDLAMSLDNLATCQSEAGQREEALAAVREAAELYRELAAGNREAFLSDFARSLNNLANRQSEAGQRGEALATVREAAELYGELAVGNRDAFLPALAATLNNLANRQNDVGQRGRALATAGEAAALYGELVAGNRAAFLPALAMSLNNLANRQSEAGQRGEALATAEEAAALRRELAAGNREAFLPDLAVSLSTLALRQSEAGQRGEALATAGEAVALRRELAAGNREAFLPDLAKSLNNLATCQIQAGQGREALAAAQEAARLYRELMQRGRDTFSVDFAHVAGTLGLTLNGLDRKADAVLAFAEGIHAILPIAKAYPGALVSLLFQLLRNYVSSSQAAAIEPDTALMQEARGILEPYLKPPEKEGGEP